MKPPLSLWGKQAHSFMIMENVVYMASSRQWILDSYGMIGLQQEISWNFGAALLHELNYGTEKAFSLTLIAVSLRIS